MTAYRLSPEMRGALVRAVTWHLLGAGFDRSDELEARLGITSEPKVDEIEKLGGQLSACAQVLRMAEDGTLTDPTDELRALVDTFLSELARDASENEERGFERDALLDRARFELLSDFRELAQKKQLAGSVA
jgi:hypothetical protein